MEEQYFPSKLFIGIVIALLALCKMKKREFARGMKRGLFDNKRNVQQGSECSDMAAAFFSQTASQLFSVLC